MRAKIRHKPRKGYNHTITGKQSGALIACNCCGYEGPADVIRSTALTSGFMERCAECRSLNFSYEESTMWRQDDWTGCYPSNWKGLIIPGAMSHPAKFSSKLIRKIYEHMQAEGWIK